MTPESRARIALGGGVLVGLGLALLGLLEADVAAHLAARDAIAIVDGQPIARADYDRAFESLVSDRRDGPQEGDRERLRDRLVDEELLLQHALRLDLPRSDPRLRGQLVRAVIDAVVADAEADEPGEGPLRAFHAENRAYFAQPGRRRVRRYFVRGTEEAARGRATALRADLEAGRAVTGDRAVPVPDVLLPAAKLEQYLGPTLAGAAARLDPGVPSQPIAAGGGLHVLVVVEAEPPIHPPFAEVRELVRGEYRRRAGERALRDYLARLRAGAEIELGPVE